ncbi:hypothetical protein Tco_0180577 [Tanacetum coccineum]
MYHKKNVDYAYIMWEDFVYQVENKNVKKSNEMDDHMFTMIKVVSRHEDTQLYGAILPDDLTNEAIKDSESYKEYYAIASGSELPKTKASVKKKQVESDKAKTPLATKGKRLKKTAKVTKPSMKKQPTQGLETRSEVALTEEEQMRIVTKRSLTEYHSFHASGSGADEGTGVTPGILDEYDEHDDEEKGDDDAQTDSDNDGDDFVHPNDEEIQDANVEGDKMNEEVEVDALYRDVNVNLEGRDTEMTDAPCIIIQTTQVIEDTLVIITSVNPEGQQQSSSVSSGFVSNMLNPSPDTGIDSLFNLNTESTSLVDVPVITFDELPLVSVTTLPPPPTPLIIHLQQTPVPTPPTVPSSSLQDHPNFGSLFRFDHRLKTLENNFLEVNQTNQFAAVVSSILGIVDAYLANKMHEAVKTVTVNEQLEAEVLTRSSNESKTSHAVAASLSELELKKILLDKMESNKSIHKFDEQKNLYKVLVNAYKSDKLIFDTYGDTVSFKRHIDDEDKDEEPSTGSNRGSKRRRAGKEPESTSAPKEKTSKTTGNSIEGSKSHHKSASDSAQTKEPMHTTKDLEEPAHQEFET